MTHKDDKFRLNECPKCKRLEGVAKGWKDVYEGHHAVNTVVFEELRAEVTRLTAELDKCTNVAIMYRGQIKQYQQDETWYQQRGSGVMK